MIKKIGLAIVLLLPLIANAVDQLTLNLESISSDDWHLHGVRFGLSGLTEDRQTLSLAVEKMVLPEPFDGFTLIDINCSILQVNDNEIRCRKGVGLIKSPWLDSSKVNLSFHITEHSNKLSIDNIKFSGGRLSINAEDSLTGWHVVLKGKALNIAKLTKLFSVAAIDVSAGQISFHADAEVDGNGLKKLDLNTQLTGVSLQTQDGKYACENLGADLQIQAQPDKKYAWVFEQNIKLTQGAVYIEPVYLELTNNPVEFKSRGRWQDKDSRLAFTEARLKHRGLGVINGSITLLSKDSIKVDQADLILTTDKLEDLSATYIQPFFEASALEGLGFSGELEAHLAIVQQTLTNVEINFTNIDVSDENARVRLKQGQGTVNWTHQRSSESQTDIAWQSLEILNIPIAATALSLNTDAGFFELNKRAVLPVLGGLINIEHFSIYKWEDDEPDVHFAGSVDGISLQQLSAALEWQPLKGTITGNIPGVIYRQKRLYLDGELYANIFDGEIRIKNLSSSGILTDFAQFYAEIEIDNLDLYQLTQAFDFGDMTGRLSGYVRDIYLENWQPVTFTAWLGTPEDDDSKHRISQRAVNSISSIGGGGAADVLSRTVLRFFDNFGYDKLGVGCVLQQGVCQLQGVDEAEQGYTIIKGGGLPRIDVIGYNSRIDWDVLMTRLERVTGSDEIIMQ